MPRNCLLKVSLFFFLRERDAEKQIKKTENRWVIHVDMDCYFVSVSIKDRPELKGKPVAVCHSKKTKGSGEISSVSYEGRKYGVKAGMWLSRAQTLCPDLILIPYNFERYLETSTAIYEIFFSYSNIVQSQSIDEAYLQFPKEGINNPLELAEDIRKTVFEKTRCPASAGVGTNILLARLGPISIYSFFFHSFPLFEQK